MTTPESVPVQSKRKWHRRLMRAIFIGWMPRTTSGFFRFVMWFAPFVIMGVGFLCSEYLPRNWPDLALLGIWPWAFVELILILIWLGYEIWYSANRNTEGSELQLDVVVDMAIALSLVGWICWQKGSGISVGWWVYLPCIGAVIDMIQSAVLGINNSLQKPGVSSKIGT